MFWFIDKEGDIHILYTHLHKINICVHILHVNVSVNICAFVYKIFLAQEGDAFLFNVSLEKSSSSALGGSARGRTWKEVTVGTCAVLGRPDCGVGGKFMKGLNSIPPGLCEPGVTNCQWNRV